MSPHNGGCNRDDQAFVADLPAKAGSPEPLHLMHSFGRKCSECGRMTWPGMAGAAIRWTWDIEEWAFAPDNCAA